MTRDLPTLLQDALCLYGPAVAELETRFSPPGGITTFIGRDDPSALPVDEEGMGYGDEPFEEAARLLLSPLVEETYALLDSCSVTRNRREPLSVISRRSAANTHSGPPYVTASVSDGLGGMFAKRSGHVSSTGMLFLRAAELHVQTVIGIPRSGKDAFRPALEEAMRSGFVEGARFAVHNDLVLNLDNSRKDAFLHWFDEFTAGEDGAVPDDVAGVLRFGTRSTDPAIKIVALTEQAWEEGLSSQGMTSIRDGGVPFELAYRLTSSPPTPTLR